MELVSLSAEGRILLTLMHGKHTYGELRLEAGLSDRWLTIKLEELQRARIVEKSGKWYGLSEELPAPSYELSLYMIYQARRMAAEVAKLRYVKAVILFGGVAQKKASESSDLDMMIVVTGPVDDARKKVMQEISRLEIKYHMAIGPLVMSRKDFLDNIGSREGGIAYGLAEGYEVLVDKNGKLAEVLRDRVEEIRSSCEYLEEARIWLKTR